MDMKHSEETNPQGTWGDIRARAGLHIPISETCSGPNLAIASSPHFVSVLVINTNTKRSN